MSNWKTIEAHHQASKKFYIFSDGPHTHTLAQKHFARACAVEMHANISQEPPNAEICTKKCRAPEPRTTLHRAILYKNFTIRATFIQKFTGKMPRPRVSPERRHTLCASLRSRNALSTFHKSHFILKFTGKKAGRPRVSTLIKQRPLQQP